MNYVIAYSLTRKVLYLFLNIFTLVEFFKSVWSLFHITGPLTLKHIHFSVVLQYTFFAWYIIITCSKSNAHSEPLFKELKLLHLEDIRKLQELKCYYKLVHRQLPSYFNCISVTTINTVHQHNTRKAGNLYADRVNHDFNLLSDVFDLV